MAQYLERFEQGRSQRAVLPSRLFHNHLEQPALLRGGFPRRCLRRTRTLEPCGAHLGSGKKRPVLLLAYTDVVAVQREKWPMDPFAAIMENGYIWGRGTTDDKGKLVSNLMQMLLMKAQRRDARPRCRCGSAENMGHKASAAGTAFFQLLVMTHRRSGSATWQRPSLSPARN